MREFHVMKKKPLDLRPTQFVFGSKEVEAKVKKITKLNDSELTDYVDSHIVPCVIGPQKRFYMIDHHHFVYASFKSDLPKIKVKVIDDQHQLTTDKFWKMMRVKKRAYLYDNFGGGPHDPRLLPMDVRGLIDDIYRSLAYELREAGVIENEQRPFAEFKWVEFLRERLDPELPVQHYAKALKQALKIVRDEIANDPSKHKKKASVRDIKTAS